MAAVLLFYCSHSYSDTVYGQTQNAAANGLTWGMRGVLPQQSGLTVSGVIYRYTAVKDPNSDMLVHVQNEDAQGPGYIFRETDDWSGRPGNTINKLVPVSNILLERWGDGSIEVEGEGSVENAAVVYNYQYDPCFDPQSNPACPGYRAEVLVEIMDPTQYIKDPLDDELIMDELEKRPPSKDEDEEEEDRKAMKEKQEKLQELEVLLGGINSALVNEQARIKHNQLMALNFIPTTYQASLPGGKYEETLSYPQTELPKSQRGARVGLAQELLHQKMVDAQYE